MACCSLIDVGGTFYGTTEEGGKSAFGTVFSITPSGDETILYSFTTSSNPGGSLLNVGGTLYGTTFLGGSAAVGTLFSLSAHGEQVVYSFTGEPNAADPTTGVIKLGGSLYGTASGGLGYGTVFSISP